MPLIAAILVGTLPYVLADEWLTRGADVPAGADAFTKARFIVSLALAVTLNPGKLFVLLIIAVVILLFFLVYRLFSGWAYRATRHPFASGPPTRSPSPGRSASRSRSRGDEPHGSTGSLPRKDAFMRTIVRLRKAAKATQAR